MNQNDNDHKIGELTGRVDSMEKRQDEIYLIVKDIDTKMNEDKGARRALHWVYIFVVSVLMFKFGDVARLFTGGK